MPQYSSFFVSGEEDWTIIGKTVLDAVLLSNVAVNLEVIVSLVRVGQ